MNDTKIDEHSVEFRALEDPAKTAIEVIAMWRGTAMQVCHFRTDDNKAKDYNVGEELDCQFQIPAEELAGRTRIPLLTVREDGRAMVAVLPGAGGDVTERGGQRCSLTAAADVLADGRPGFTVSQGTRIKMELGPWTFLINGVPGPKKFKAPFHWRWSSNVYIAASFLFHGVIALALLLVPPNPEGLFLDLSDTNDRFVAILLQPQQVIRHQPLGLQGRPVEKSEGASGQAEEGPAGKAGDPQSAKTRNRMAIRALKDARERYLAKPRENKPVENAGVLALLGEVSMPTSIFGRSIASGMDPENALGDLLGDRAGQNIGFGGLAVHGTGRRGGGDGRGAIGLDRLGTIGIGGKHGSEYGRRAGNLNGNGMRRPGGVVPQPRRPPFQASGSMTKDVIRRIVHRHLNEVKHCYESRLSKQPDLSGRVAVKFIISGTGGVQAALLASSTLGDPVVEQCIVAAVRRWAFPQPKGGGVVIVTYPFFLTSADS